MTRLAFLVVPLGIAMADCSSASSATEPSSDAACLLVPRGYGPAGAVPIQVHTAVTGLEVPWGIAFLPGGDWLVTERPGRVRLVTGGKLVPEPVVTLDVAGDADGGLLGIAASPRFESNRMFYVYATFEDGERYNRVLRYELSGDHRSAVLDEVIADRLPGAPFGDGGRIRFGPDGMLYVATGGAHDPARPGSRGGLAGKLLRIDPEGGVPADNPHGRGSPVFLSGLRDCNGFDWITPRILAVADHGEVSVAVSGLHLGWPDIHGCESAPGELPPLLAWAERVPAGGAAVYTSYNIPEWTGSLLMGTLDSKHLHRIALDRRDLRKLVVHEAYLVGEPPSGHGRLREVAMGPDGDLYVTTSNCDGRGKCPPDKDRVLRITR